jgi:hypothetical protein
MLVATVGVAALAAAGQLGIAYGLGIVRLTRVLDVTTRDQWTAQLAWVAWLAMSAAVIGAVVGVRVAPDRTYSRPAYGIGTAVSVALAAGAGAFTVVPLTMQPARTAQIAGVHPVLVIGIAAALGAVAGVLAALAALTQEVARRNLIAVGACVWAIALLSVAPSLAPGDPLPAVRLGVFDAAYLAPAVTQRTALFTMPAIALVAGAVFGWLARRQGCGTFTIALAGLPGPALLTVAYLIAGPGSGPAHYQVVPYWAAMTATAAGLLGSVLAAVLPSDENTEAAGLPSDENSHAAEPPSDENTDAAEPPSGDNTDAAVPPSDEKTDAAVLPADAETDTDPTPSADQAEPPAPAQPPATADPEPPGSGPATYGWAEDGIYRTSQTGSGVSTTSPSP